MRICIVGGIFDKSAAYRSQHSISPETVLADGMRQRGWDVVACGHLQPLNAASFDVVHVHHLGRAALRLARMVHRPPFALTTHDPFAMNGLPIGWKRRLTDGFVFRRADALVALSNAERDFLVGQGIARQSVVVIPNGIRTDTFDRTSAPSDAVRMEILFVGQLKAFKGLQYLLEALPVVRAAYPQIKLRVVYQTDALLDHYRAQAAKLGLEPCLEFAGRKTAAELAELYSSAVLVVSPSLGECLSTVVLEAMCCGAAVIATDVGGIREQLDEDTGMIVPPRDAPALAHAICTLLANEDRRRSLGRAARQKARSQFNVRNMIDRHVRLYEELLETDERAA
jgi:glycosyltransferase involved in cell wall biosynthesis